MVNTKYISLSVLKISEFSQMRSTSENSDVFNSRDEIYIFRIYQKKQIIFLTYTFYRLHAMSRLLKKEVLKLQKGNILENPNNFGTKIFVTF